MPQKRKLIRPELVDPAKRRWTYHEVTIRKASVDLEQARAYVPRPTTRARRLARLHELGHVKYTPQRWSEAMAQAMQHVESLGMEVDAGVLFNVLKMMEENRIDCLLWTRHGIDLRPAREVMNWEGMPVPEEPAQAVTWVLQLCWTVWASRGIKHIPNAPPARAPEERTAAFFDKCWQVVLEHEQGGELAAAIVQACIAVYEAETLEESSVARDKGAAEIASYFPPKKEKQPEENEEEEEEAERQEQEQDNEEKSREKAEEEKESGGVGNEPIRQGYIQIHDHTRGFRRPTTRISRRDVPEYMGTRVAFPQRYMLDGGIFGRRTLTQASIMIDGSGSMRWTDEMLKQLIALMPAVTLGMYGGYRTPANMWTIFKTGTPPADGIYGRICVLANHGRIASYTGREEGWTGGNDCDLYALQYMRRWPGPRFWLSDGLVGGGPGCGPYPNIERQTDYLEQDGKILYEVNRTMKALGILRVPDLETMIQMLRRRPVVLYRSAVNWAGTSGLDPKRRPITGSENWTPELRLRQRRRFYPDWMTEEPIRYQL